MYAERLQPVSGHVFSREGKRGTVWYAKWRDVEGQHQKKLGPGWTAKGAPPVGYLRRREAQAELEAILVDSRRGALRRDDDQGLPLGRKRAPAAGVRREACRRDHIAVDRAVALGLAR